MRVNQSRVIGYLRRSDIVARRIGGNEGHARSRLGIFPRISQLGSLRQQRCYRYSTTIVRYPRYLTRQINELQLFSLRKRCRKFFHFRLIVIAFAYFFTSFYLYKYFGSWKRVILFIYSEPYKRSS